MPKLTKRTVDGLKPKPKGDSFVWDSEVRGLGIRIKPSGSRSYLIQYRNQAYRTRRMVLGSCGILSLEQARDLARERLVQVVKGEDPSAERKLMRKSKTVSDLCEWYLEEAEAGRLLGRKRRAIKPSSLKMDRSCIDNHVKPLVGSMIVRGLTRLDIDKMMSDIVAGKTARSREGRGGVTTGGLGVAVRTVTVLHAIFEHAIRFDMIEINPCRGIRKPASRSRDRRLSETEIMTFGKTLGEMERDGESPTGLTALKFLLMTGFRRSEALTLENCWLGKSSAYVAFPDTKTGKQTRIVGKAAANLLQPIINQEGSRYVFPAEVGQGHFVGLSGILKRLSSRAVISGITLHTLRHTFSSMVAELGFSELTIAGLLGHAKSAVTQRYVHLDESLVVAADRVSERVGHLLASKSIRTSKTSAGRSEMNWHLLD